MCCMVAQALFNVIVGVGLIIGLAFLVHGKPSPGPYRYITISFDLLQSRSSSLMIVLGGNSALEAVGKGILAFVNRVQ